MKEAAPPPSRIWLCAALASACALSAMFWERAPASALQKKKEPVLVASILPVHALLAGVAGAQAVPHLLLPQGASPHHYALRPSEAKLLQGADLVFWMGAETETFLERPLRALLPQSQAIALGEEGEDHEEHEEGHDGEHQDTHLWLDPLYAIEMTEKISAALSKKDPHNKSVYQRNARDQIKRLRALHREVERAMRPYARARYLVFHDAYGTFAKRYGLQSAEFLLLTPERKMGAQRLRALRRAIRKEGIGCVFSEPGASPALLRALLGGSSAKSVELDPLGWGLTPGRDAYFMLIRNLYRQMASCFREAS